MQLALAASGCDQARVVHKPRLLSDNGSSYVSADLAEWLDDNGMRHVRGAPHHPQTQGKIDFADPTCIWCRPRKLPFAYRVNPNEP